ncbi:MAG: glycosyltransferase [Gemella sp.]|nr:glycosyltransferase [Gemella sp.]
MISIIVPVYKVEKYLERCVDSIINQTYKNLEIILVDDGSPDNSGKLADELAKKDDRIVVYHKENGGLSDARNYGVAGAKGTYIGFVDSDDYINENMYQNLYDLIKTENTLVAESNVTRIYGNKERPHYEGPSYRKTIDTKEYIREYLTMEKVYGSVWCKLIDANLAKELTFPKGKYYEDIYYNYDLVQKIDKISITSEAHYYYYIRENSITTEKYSPKQLDLIEILDKLKSFVDISYPDLKEEAFIRQVYAYLSTFNHMILEDNYKSIERFDEVYKFLKDNKSKVLASKNAAKNLKLSLAVLSVNAGLYKILYKVYKSRMVLNK